MKFLLTSWIFFLPFLQPFLVAQPVSGGHLVIVGGGLEDNNRLVFKRFIDLAGGSAHARIAVIPAAGGAPVQSFAWFRHRLGVYGADTNQIILIPVALADDDSTTATDESKWKDHGYDTAVARLVRSCTGVWFTGGDQLRVIKTLVRVDGRLSPVLDAVWDVYRRGGVIGGTSAGAAIMSNPMIGGGTSIAALAHGVITRYAGDDFPADSGVMLTSGIGFFPHGIVDQHFHARSRTGRLATVLHYLHGKTELGIGIDENTAMIYSAGDQTMTVAGTGGVTLLNTSAATLSQAGSYPALTNVILSYLEEGDGYDFATGRTTPASGKSLEQQVAKPEAPLVNYSGLLSGEMPTFRDFLARLVTGNQPAGHMVSTSGISDQTGYRLTLRLVPGESECFSDGKPHRDSFTAARIRMDLIPVKITEIPIQPHK